MASGRGKGRGGRKTGGKEEASVTSIWPFQPSSGARAMTRLWMIPRRFWEACHFVQAQKYPQRRKLIVQLLLALI